MTLPLPEGKFGVIYADPPWDWKAHSPKGESRSAKRHYRTLQLDEIKALPVASLAAPNCALFLWIIRPLIFDARAIVEAWGFTGKSIAFVWVKPRKDRQADLLNPERDFPFANGLWHARQCRNLSISDARQSKAAPCRCPRRD